MENYKINTGEIKSDFVIYAEEYYTVFSGGTALSATVSGIPNHPGNLNIESRGLALPTMISLGNLRVYSGGTASHTSVYGNQGDSYMGVKSGGTADNTSVFANGRCSVDGIVTNSLIFGKGAYMNVGEGGSASRTTVGMSGVFYIAGSADDTVVDDR